MSTPGAATFFQTGAAGGGDDVLGTSIIKRADLVVGAPFAPVLVFLRGLAEVVSRYFAPGHWLSISKQSAACPSFGQ